MTLSVRVLLTIGAVAAPCMAAQAQPGTPGCDGLAARECVALAQTAMGGAQKLADVHSVRLDVISHTTVMEQSYRQAPFYTAYERDKTTIDLAGARLRTEAHSVWPESDLGQGDTDNILIVTAHGGVYHGAQGDSPCSLADLDGTRATVALGPLRLLATALAAADLHYAAPQTVRGAPHAVLAFTWQGQPVRVLLNSFNHLPDAVETTWQPHDFWYFWGDVQERRYWDNWRYTHGITYPSSEIVERNGATWNSSQVLDVKFNGAIEEKDFAADPKAVAQSVAQKGWDRPFKAAQDTSLAAGIDLYSGSWNTTIVRQDDGVVILETPISALFTQGIFAEAARRYPGAKIKAVVTTSDSWPHVGGIRFDVARGMPIYVLDANVPLLDRLLAAPHRLAPDALQSAPRKPDWQVVTAKRVIGAGANRMELYPLRGASTERQYMVYFPAQRLLYASDTLVLNEDHSLYDPQLMHEVRQAVEREHLNVDTVYAMHQAPSAWKDVIALLDASA
jgi:hypothetical protein